MSKVPFSIKKQYVSKHTFSLDEKYLRSVLLINNLVSARLLYIYIYIYVMHLNEF